MIDYNQAADTLKRLARDREAMQFAADAFTSLGSIEQATKEATQAYDRAATSLADMRECVRQSSLELVQAQDKARQTGEKADRDAAGLLEAAVQRIQDAETQSAERITRNMDAAAKEAAGKAAALDHRLQVVVESVRELTGREADLKESIAAKAVQLGDLESRFRQAKDAAAALLA